MKLSYCAIKHDNDKSTRETENQSHLFFNLVNISRVSTLCQAMYQELRTKQ